MRTLRRAEGPHPWVIQELSLVTLHGAPRYDAGDGHTDGHERGVPGSGESVLGYNTVVPPYPPGRYVEG